MRTRHELPRIGQAAASLALALAGHALLASPPTAAAAVLPTSGTETFVGTY